MQLKSDNENETSLDLQAALEKLTQPGVIFSEPVQNGDTICITAARYKIERDEVMAKPLAVIVSGPKGTKIEYIQDNERVMGTIMVISVVAIVGWASVLLFHPPWRRDINLIDEIQSLIRTIRNR